MKGKIVELKEVFDEVECIIKYQIVIWSNDKPNLRLGECEVKNG